ncbi:FMN-binding negative transcriptional regulator [Deinococcus oregonensis]|uniref:FMN-binding negative transcriptional regulator n=1 Tax=Deinococcus oregonensis TaxID=1805970 RepID=A0ABV6BAH0_9DEIO
MYIPPSFQESDQDAQVALMRQYPFATLVTTTLGVPFATHLPLLISQDDGKIRLYGHVARANPQPNHFGGGEALAIFHGPHALVHSGWYESSPHVPTWNYVVVHATGPITVLDGEMPLTIARRLTETFTPDAPPIPEAFESKLVGGVVTFEMQVRDLKGKFKLSQNKSVQDRANVAAALAMSDREVERDLAALMHIS